jgi:CRISPR-associated protein Cas5h
MKCVIFNIKSNYGLFRKHEFNNNEITYSFIPKTALIGMIGAVTGINRNDMNEKYWNILMKDLKYNLVFKKKRLTKNLSFYQTNFDNLTQKNRPLKSPKSSEYLKNIDWDIYLLIDEKKSDSSSVEIFDKFVHFIKNDISIYPPKMGRNECNATIEYLDYFDDVKYSENVEEFDTIGFVKKLITSTSLSISKETNIYLEQYFHKGSDKNLEKINKVDLIFCDDGGILTTKDNYYLVNNEKFIFI